MPSLSKTFEGVAGGFLVLEGAASIVANPSDPPAWQFSRVARILIGVAMVLNAMGK